MQPENQHFVASKWGASVGRGAGDLRFALSDSRTCEASRGESRVHLPPFTIADRAAEELVEDRSWRLVPIECQDAHGGDEEMLDKGWIRSRYLERAFERPHSLFGIGCRTALANHLEERRWVEAVPIHRDSSIATKAAGSHALFRPDDASAAFACGQLGYATECRSITRRF